MGQTEKTTREGAERSRVKGAMVGRAETPGEMLLSLLPLSAFAACQSIALPPPPPSLALGRGGAQPTWSNFSFLVLEALQFGQPCCHHVPTSAPFFSPKKTHNLHTFLTAKITHLSKSSFSKTPDPVPRRMRSDSPEISMASYLYFFESDYQVLPHTVVILFLLYSLATGSPRKDLSTFILPRATVN